MARQETQRKVTALESTLTAANDVSSINSVVAHSTKDLLDTTQGVHMTQAYKDQLVSIGSKLDEKKKVLEEKHKQLTEENAKLDTEYATLTSSTGSFELNKSQFDTDLGDLKTKGMVSSFLPTSLSSLSTGTLSPLRVIDQSTSPRPNVKDPGDVRAYNNAVSDAKRIYNDLLSLLRNIRTEEQSITANRKKHAENASKLGPIPTTITELNKRQSDIQAIPNATSDFVGLDGADCHGSLTDTTYDSFDDLVSAGTAGTRFELRDAQGHILTPITATVAGTSVSCLRITITQSDGRSLTRLIKASDLTIDASTGRVTFAAGAQLYDHTGAVYMPPQGEIAFDVYPTAVVAVASINLYHSKKLSVKRTLDSFSKASVLDTNPAVTNLFAHNFPLYITQYVDHPDNPKSEFTQTIMTSLEKHPDFAKLPKNHKDIIFERLIHAFPTTPTAGQEYPLMTLESIMRVTDIMNPSYSPLPGPTGGPSQFIANPYDAFKEYVLDAKHVEPKPSADDTKDETAYSNWLARNMTTLLSNFVKHHINACLDRSDVAQGINEYVSRYTTSYEMQKINGVTNLVPDIQSAAKDLRNCLPEGYNRKTTNDSWMRLMTDKGASIADTITREDGSTLNYTTSIHMRSGKGVSVTLTLGAEKPIILAGSTPGDILAKILTGCGGRVDAQRDRLMLAFSTMKAIVKVSKEAGVHMTVPINGTNGDELRVTMDEKDMIKVERYDRNPNSDTFDKNDTPGMSFDEHNSEHKNSMTPAFLVKMNEVTNKILDRQYNQFRDTMKDGSRMINNFTRWMTFGRERLSYKANPRFLRGVLTKWINRKESSIGSFSFPIQTANKTGSVTYDPSGMITVEVGGKTRKSKNLAKLLNPWTMRNLFGIFNNKKNITDGLEMQIMQGLYEGLSGQLMDNSKVNKYTYLVRDPQTQIMYAMYQDDTGKTQMGIIENVSTNIGSIDSTRDMLLMSRQKRGRCVGMPPQGVRQLDDTERAALMARPEIMDGFMQNMLKAREEIVRVGVGKYRSASLTTNVVSDLAITGVIGGIDLATGGLLSSTAYAGGQAINTGLASIPSATGPVTKVVNGARDAISAAWKIPVQGIKGLLGMGK